MVKTGIIDNSTFNRSHSIGFFCASLQKVKVDSVFPNMEPVSACLEHMTNFFFPNLQALRGLAPGITALSWIVSFVGNTFSHGPC